jgi:hypothetical protein
MVSVSVRSHWRSSGRSGSATVRFGRERAGMGKRGLAALCVGAVWMRRACGTEEILGAVGLGVPTAARGRDAGVALGCCAQEDFRSRIAMDRLE